MIYQTTHNTSDEKFIYSLQSITHRPLFNPLVTEAWVVVVVGVGGGGYVGGGWDVFVVVGGWVGGGAGGGGGVVVVCVSLMFQFCELSKISRNLCIAEIALLMRISSWNFVCVPKAMLWTHVQSSSLKFSSLMVFLELYICARLFWRFREMLVKQPPEYFRRSVLSLLMTWLLVSMDMGFFSFMENFKLPATSESEGMM